MSEHITIVKRTRGQSETYDNRKLYTSVRASCLAANAPIGSAEIAADHVLRNVERWLSRKFEVTSDDIRRIAAGHLRVYHPEASFMYAHSRSLL